MLSRTLTDDYRPATFLERGVAAPFTTPFLTTARVKDHEDWRKSVNVLDLKARNELIRPYAA